MTAIKILKFVGVPPRQLQNLLQDFGGILPQTEAQLTELTQKIRRTNRLHNGPFSVASLLYGSHHSSQAYMQNFEDEQSSGHTSESIPWVQDTSATESENGDQESAFMMNWGGYLPPQPLSQDAQLGTYMADAEGDSG